MVKDHAIETEVLAAGERDESSNRIKKTARSTAPALKEKINCVPFRNRLLMVGCAGGSMVSENDLVLVTLALSTTRAVKLNGPAVVGVPLNVPSAARESPPGKLPEATDQV